MPLELNFTDEGVSLGDPNDCISLPMITLVFLCLHTCPCAEVMVGV